MFNEEQAISGDIKHKGITAIIPTYNSPPQLFALSLLSLFLNSTDYLQHAIVSINGPDKRTGTTANQDKKQKFLERIRNFLPITVQRVWSRIGQGQAIDSAYPWVHTQDYLVMHDDMLVLNSMWCDIVQRKLERPNIAAVYYEDPIYLVDGIHHEYKVHSIKGKTYLTVPRLCTEFTAVKKSATGAKKWSGYWIDGPVKVTWPNHLSAMKQYSTVDTITYETGSFIRQQMEAEDKRVVKLGGPMKVKEGMSEELLYHYGCFSNAPNHHFKNERIRIAVPMIKMIEMGVREKWPQIYAFYEQHFGAETSITAPVSYRIISEKSKELRVHGTGRKGKNHGAFLNRTSVQES